MHFMSCMYTLVFGVSALVREIIKYGEREKKGEQKLYGDEPMPEP